MVLKNVSLLVLGTTVDNDTDITFMHSSQEYYKDNEL